MSAPLPQAVRPLSEESLPIQALIARLLADNAAMQAQLAVLRETVTLQRGIVQHLREQLAEIEGLPSEPEPDDRDELH